MFHHDTMQVLEVLVQTCSQAKVAGLARSLSLVKITDTPAIEPVTWPGAVLAGAATHTCTRPTRAVRIATPLYRNK